MAKLNIALKHPMTTQDAKARLEKERLRLMGLLDGQGEGSAEWSGDTLHVSIRYLKQSVTGTLALSEGTADLQAVVPLPLLIFRQKVENRLKKLLKVEG